MLKQRKIFLFVLVLSLLLAGCGKEGQIRKENAQDQMTQQNGTEEKQQESIPAESSDSTGGVYTDAVKIELNDNGILIDGQIATNNQEAAVYIANDIIFYLADQGFTYGEGGKDEEHTQEEADAHSVVHITKPGVYELSGKLSKGQIAVDLGKDAEEDSKAVVTLVLNGVDITCEVAPAVIFYNVYECNIFDESNATYEVDTTAAGANVVLADGSVNYVTGSHVARIYKSYTLNEAGTEVIDNKKLHKYDGAFYSKMSMNIFGGSKGDGVLNIQADNEGLDSEMHLTLNGGIINIESENDGINTNEDGISVTTLNDGELYIKVNGSTGEGDGIDSNGWLVINGGTLYSAACSKSMDAGIDSDMGIYINGGSVMATGNMLDRIEGGSAIYAVFTFATTQKAGSVYTMKDTTGKVVGSWKAINDFGNLIVSDKNMKEGTYTLWLDDKQLVASQGQSFESRPGVFAGNPFEGGQFPDGMERPEGGQFPDGMKMPEGGKFPGRMERPEGGKFPDGMERPEGGKFPDGMERPEGGKFPGGTERFEGNRNAELSEYIKLSAGANYFSNVQIKQ